MADTFIGINNSGLRDNGDANFTVGSSTGSTDIELRIDLTKEWTKGSAARVVRAMAEFLDGHAQSPIL